MTKQSEVATDRPFIQEDVCATCGYEYGSHCKLEDWSVTTWLSTRPCGGRSSFTPLSEPLVKE